MSRERTALVIAALVLLPDLPVLEGWGDWPFGVSIAAVWERLAGTGAYSAGAIRIELPFDGVGYSALLKFRDGGLHEIFMRSGVKPSIVAGDRACRAGHARVVGAVGNDHPASRPISSVGGSGALSLVTEFAFARGAMISVVTKVLPALRGDDLCDTTIQVRAGESQN